MINNTALRDDHYDEIDKNFVKGRDHFLYFAGPGNIHKGLDLLLEAFSKLEQHLWICSKMDKKFVDVYSNELYDCENIHLIGCVQLRSVQFYEVMQTCNYAILPSCSEGGAHSIIECMNQGLIPVVSRACGLDVNNYGLILAPCTLEEICRMVRRLSSYSATQCREMSVKAREAAVTAFSEIAFHQNLRHALESIIGGIR
jgi:glycosyltransferase involved in cell wall biosynthesis